MEVDFSFFSIIFTFLLFVFLVLKLGKISKTTEKTSNLPPSPWKLPIFGNLHQLIGSMPHQGLRELAKKYGPLMHLTLGEISAIVVSSPEVAKEVMQTHDAIFASRGHNIAIKIMSYDCTDIAFAPYGEYWRQLRKICTLEFLNMKRVQSFRSIREEETSSLISWIDSKAGSVVNLTEKIHSLTHGVTSRAAFGKKCKDQELFMSCIERATILAAGLNIADLFPSIGLLQWISGIRPRLEWLHRKADKILDNIISEHKDKARILEIGKSSEVDEDLVDVLLKLQEHGDPEFHLTTNNIKAVITDVFSAGGDSSATTIDWAMVELIKNPRLMTMAQTEVREVFDRRGVVDETGINEMKFLKQIIKETLRLHPTAPLLVPRESRENCVVNGFDIPAKTKVVINAWAIGRDPEYWTEPESFIPERFLDSPIDYKGTNFEYIPFGAGRRICPGMSFGLASIELPLAMLLYHFNWKLPTGMQAEKLDMTEAISETVRRRDSLCLIPIPYHP
ncbi:hypothetical protein ACOSQ3_030735 [Xanthoceras sorbifolium]